MKREEIEKKNWVSRTRVAFVGFLIIAAGIAYASSAQASGCEYVVQPGDSLSKIAQKLGIQSWQTLYNANRETIGDNPSLIRLGMQFNICLGIGGPTEKILKPEPAVKPTTKAPAPKPVSSPVRPSTYCRDVIHPQYDLSSPVKIESCDLGPGETVLSSLYNVPGQVLFVARPLDRNPGIRAGLAAPEQAKEFLKGAPLKLIVRESPKPHSEFGGDTTAIAKSGDRNTISGSIESGATPWMLSLENLSSIPAKVRINVDASVMGCDGPITVHESIGGGPQIEWIICRWGIHDLDGTKH